jgi:hypothetical protein
MQLLRIVRVGSLIGCTIVAAACSDSTGPQDVSIDEVLADVSVGQSLATRGIELVGVGAVPEPAALRHDACAFNGTSMSFVCPSTTVNGITFSRFFQLLDASGAPQSEYERATTAAVRVVTDVDGIITATTGGSTTTIDLTAHQDATLSGLLSGTHILNANGTGNAEIDGGGLNHDIATTQTVTNLHLPRHDDDDRYPDSGTIARSAVITAPGFTNTTTATLTFDGSSEATLVITNFGVTQTCKIDLSQRHSQPDCGP